MNPSLASAAQVVQLALTPIFLLAGLASLLNVFTIRLNRIADRVDRLLVDPLGKELQLSRLRLRSRLLDAAVLLCALAGALTCCAALALFVGALTDRGGAILLFGLFGAALVCAIGALGAYAVETVLSGRTIRDQARS
ncbi:MULTISPECIES: DUF2721 domain-containing protein [unclassified Aureimonas]|uniref:DUF2721 domain-containing protein n=1 Tax=unclassified Aureimonas TaxID=2615206 RepID=UPI0006F97B86|nr:MULTISPECIES: DUF2721 domain-containing protein [unclassified Aureimonas]KQT55185.1 hypothetical protein ASG62_10095 [Aureimonas sp. Leaf427]KQT70975.1 hypothetical protein ASG54_20480 [Aureimonas sp. Leaf460]